MPNIILQPTSNNDAYEHFIKTIKNPIKLSDITRYLTPTVIEALKLIYPDGNIYMWGVTNGKHDINKNKWERINSGDITLFSKKGGIFYSAITTFKIHNPGLARYVWGTNRFGETWEYIYFINHTKLTNIPYDRFNPALGYAKNFIIQGFNILDDEKSGILISKFNIDVIKNDVDINIEMTDNEYSDIINKLEAEASLDAMIKGNSRKEQAFLRKQLFKGHDTYKCGICGKEYPIDMLTTSHIKKRCDCAKAEKLDYKNIVMPMCYFGCDRAYENKYIYVDDLGKIRVNYSKNPTQDMINTFKQFEGTTCSYFNKNTAKYFEAHRKKFEI